MKRFGTFFMIMSLGVVLTSGCTEVVHTQSDTPVIKSEADWDYFWLQLTDDRVIYCLDVDAGSTYGSLSCDWSKFYTLADVPEGENLQEVKRVYDEAVTVLSGYTETFVTDSRGMKTLCVSDSLGHISGVLSCGWEPTD